MSENHRPVTEVEAALFLLFLAVATFSFLLGYIYPETRNIIDLVCGGALGGVWGIMVFGMVKLGRVR